jgi:hypothetical protein
MSDGLFLPPRLCSLAARETDQDDFLMTIRMRGLIVAVLFSVACWAGIIGAVKSILGNTHHLEASSDFDGTEDV